MSKFKQNVIKTFSLKLVRLSTGRHHCLKPKDILQKVSFRLSYGHFWMLDKDFNLVSFGCIFAQWDDSVKELKLSSSLSSVHLECIHSRESHRWVNMLWKAPYSAWGKNLANCHLCVNHMESCGWTVCLPAFACLCVSGQSSLQNDLRSEWLLCKSSHIQQSFPFDV